MLVLSRKVGDSIVIDGEIDVVILAVQGQKIKVGIKAPLETSIRRGELIPMDVSDQSPFESSGFLTAGNS